jgi:hypothetical protein
MPSYSAAETVLVALVKGRADHAILHQQGWYRIPVDSAPSVVRQGKVKYLGFYLPSVFLAKFTLHARLRELLEFRKIYGTPSN